MYKDKKIEKAMQGAISKDNASYIDEVRSEVYAAIQKGEPNWVGLEIANRILHKVGKVRLTGYLLMDIVNDVIADSYYRMRGENPYTKEGIDLFDVLEDTLRRNKKFQIARARADKVNDRLFRDRRNQTQFDGLDELRKIKKELETKE